MFGFFHRYEKSGLLAMLHRNIQIKKAPQRWQLEASRFDVAITFEERVFDILVQGDYFSFVLVQNFFCRHANTRQHFHASNAGCEFGDKRQSRRCGNWWSRGTGTCHLGDNLLSGGGDITFAVNYVSSETVDILMKSPLCTVSQVPRREGREGTFFLYFFFPGHTNSSNSQLESIDDLEAEAAHFVSEAAARIRKNVVFTILYT